MTLLSAALPLDVLALARQGGAMQGCWPLARLGRLQDLLAAVDDASAVHWQVTAQLRPMPGGDPQPWLCLGLQARLPMVCQRCLQAVSVPLDLRREFRFVVDEATAAAQDADCEEDVLALTQALDLATLVEDELLLSLPLVPRHDRCPAPLPTSTGCGSPTDAQRRENPFAGLRDLVRGEPRGEGI